MEERLLIRVEGQNDVKIATSCVRIRILESARAWLRGVRKAATKLVESSQCFLSLLFSPFNPSLCNTVRQPLSISVVDQAHVNLLFFFFFFSPPISSNSAEDGLVQVSASSVQPDSVPITAVVGRTAVRSVSCQHITVKSCVLRRLPTFFLSFTHIVSVSGLQSNSRAFD